MRLNRGELNLLAQVVSNCFEIADRIDPKRSNKNEDARKLTMIGTLAKEILVKYAENK